MSVEEDLALCQKYVSLAESCRQRKIKFALSLQALKNVKKSKKCFYTGTPFAKDNQLSIDRVDNSKGYEDGNVVACSRDLNTRKGDLSVEEILALAAGIKRKLKKG